MTDLLELAGRVEAAEGPDRDLDALIWSLEPTTAPTMYRAAGLWPKNMSEAERASREQFWKRANAPRSSSTPGV